jgi:hypothetical protein
MIGQAITKLTLNYTWKRHYGAEQYQPQGVLNSKQFRLVHGCPLAIPKTDKIFCPGSELGLVFYMGF